MKTAFLVRGDKKSVITADEAAIRNEREAFCPDPHCRWDVYLFVQKRPKGVTHFEHRLGFPKACKLRYRR
jgi:hypothetical protein